MRTGKSRGAAILIGVVLGAAGCRGRASFPKAPVLVISIDTLRADHVPAYGYHDVATPALDALRRDAVLFENAYSHVPLTLPSHVTMLTGQLPPQAGVRDNTGYVLSADHPTLAERLGRSGYACGAAVSAVVLAKTSRIDRGFDFYDDNVEAAAPGLPLGAIQRSGFESERIAEDWVGAHADRPFFFFLHLYEPHTPYAPPEPFASTYRQRPYDGEIATADAIVGKFLAFLKAKGLYDGAVVILMSDHGEGLGDHGEQEHGLLLYRESLHVPLLVKLPGRRRAGESIARPVGLVDVFPTVLELVGLEAPPGIAGAPLLAPAAGAQGKPREIYSETLFPRYHFGWSDLAALTDDRYSYIHGPRAELFDIVADPGEKRDLSPGLPAAFRSLRAELLAIPRPRQAPGASDPEQIRKLASLGYIGQASPSETAENLPDPRDHVAELEEMRAALALYSGRRYDEAAAAFRALLAKNPGMADAWGSLAETEHKLGRHEASLAALERQDRLAPGSPHILLSFANQYLELQDFDRARLYAERALAANAPPEANEVLARIALARRDWPEAERQANLALEGHQGRKLPYIVLAQVRRARGDLPGALQMLDEVQAKLQRSGQGEMSNLHYFRADILARMDRTAEAEAEFRKELSIFPDNTAAWSGLALLHASLGHPEATRRDLEDLLRAVPTPRGYAAAAETLRILGDTESARRLEERARVGGGSAPAGQRTAAGPQRG
jgi:arylsulfatase A-like enzyme/tetratricopeptide (TPR) repeat protein